MSDTYQRILTHFYGANILGVTATPDRSDQKSLGKYFDSKAYEYSLHQAIKEGYLCPVKAQMIPLELNIHNVGVSNGDYAILFDIYIVIASINSFKDFSGGKLTSIVIFLVLAVLGHWLQRKLAKKIKRRINDDPINDKVKKYEAQIEMIIKEAKSLDYSFNDGVKEEI